MLKLVAWFVSTSFKPPSCKWLHSMASSHMMELPHLYSEGGEISYCRNISTSFTDSVKSDWTESDESSKDEAVEEVSRSHMLTVKELMPTFKLVKKPITERLNQLREHTTLIGVKNRHVHPMIKVLFMEKELLSCLETLAEDQKITSENISDLWTRLIAENETDVLSKQILANILATFATTYLSAWLKDVIFVMPSALDGLGLLSPHVLARCITPFYDFDSVSPEVDEFLWKCYRMLYDQFGPTFKSSLIGYLPTRIERTMFKHSSRWKTVYNEMVAYDDNLTNLARSVKDDMVSRAIVEKEYDLTFEIVRRLFVKVAYQSTQSFDRIASDMVKNIPPEKYNDMLDAVKPLGYEFSRENSEILLSNWNCYSRDHGFDSKAVFTRIDDRLRCMNCGHKLNEASITEDETQVLKESFFGKTMKGERAWKVGNPAEVLRFLRFFDAHGPFDVVMDGLNYLYDTEQYSVKTCAKVIEALESIGKKKFLILTRQHGVVDIPPYLKKISSTYVLEDLTLDDQFIIYAALSSGPDCYLLSSDMYKGHKSIFSKLNPDFFCLFQKWQRHRQIPKPRDLRHLDFQSNRSIPLPSQADVSVQLNQEYWHVPIMSEGLKPFSARYPLQDEWLCMKKF